MNRFDYVRPSDLAEQLLVDLSSLSRRLTTLENRGLVARVVDEQDRRAQIVALTPAGSALLASLRESAGASLAKTLSAWSLRDLDTLASLLARLDQDLGAQFADQAKASLTTALK